MEIAARRVCFAGCTSNPDEDRVIQTIRNLIDSEEVFLKGKSCLLMDRDMKYSEVFRFMLKGSDVEPIPLPSKSPSLNAFIKRGMPGTPDNVWRRIVAKCRCCVLGALSQGA